VLGSNLGLVPAVLTEALHASVGIMSRHYPFLLLGVATTIFGGAVNRNSIFSNFFITIKYPLHVSAPTGHLQVEYVPIPRSYLCYNGSVVILSYQLYIYIYICIYIQYILVSINSS
jgi:hypothetical protein